MNLPSSGRRSVTVMSHQFQKNVDYYHSRYDNVFVVSSRSPRSDGYM